MPVEHGCNDEFRWGSRGDSFLRVNMDESSMSVVSNIVGMRSAVL